MNIFKKITSSSSFGHRPDYFLIGIVFFIVLCGFLFLTSASSDIGKMQYNNSYYFLEGQVLKGFLPGIIGFFIGYFIYYRRWKKVAPYLLLINIFLMVLVFTPLGYAANGSSRWLHFGAFSFQPSELLKITFILYLASLFSSMNVKRMKQTWRAYWLFLSVSCLVGVLIIIQPATTMAVIVIGSGAVMYFFSGASFKHIALTIGFAITVIASLAIVTPYRLIRIAPFWNDVAGSISPSLEIKGVQADQFHLNQSLISIGTGGLWGVGYGRSTSKYSILPEPMGDSIFSVIAEEFGFVGSFALIATYAVLVWRMTDLVFKSHDDFARLTILGFSSVIAIEAIIHIASNSGFLPFTGVPLPFISYGGTALAVTLTMMGIVANISKHSSA